jgi:NADH dehydrogenase [ubiquinone] 1 alpha subcomplex assembly factor 5
MLSSMRLVARPTVRARRAFASVSSSGPPPSMSTVGPFKVFDRRAKTLQRDRAAVREGGARSRTVDYVREEVAERMIDRMLVCSN